MEQILLVGIDVDEFLEKVSKLIENKFKNSNITSVEHTQPKLLSRAEVASLLKISLPTLNDYTKLGWLQSYKIGKRVLYKSDEIEQALHKVLNQKHKRSAL